MFIKCLIVGFGGFLGSILRYLINLIPINETSTFPFNTLMVNILGCLAIGFISFYFMKYYPIDDNLNLFLKVGICGGFTTFSTFALESSQLLKSGSFSFAFIYIFISVFFGILAVFIPEFIG